LGSSLFPVECQLKKLRRSAIFVEQTAFLPFKLRQERHQEELAKRLEMPLLTELGKHFMGGHATKIPLLRSSKNGAIQRYRRGKRLCSIPLKTSKNQYLTFNIQHARHLLRKQPRTTAANTSSPLQATSLFHRKSEEPAALAK